MMLYRVAQWIFYNLAGGPEYCTPPGADCRLDFGPEENGKKPYYATTYNNDGFELWIGDGMGWQTFYTAAEARHLAWFILWEWWAKATWFGLRRRIWYRALSYKRKVEIARRGGR